MSEIKKIKEEYLLKLNEDLDQNKLNEIKIELFGKNGVISTKFKQLGSIAENKRKEFAAELNYLKNELEELILKKNENIQNKEIKKETLNLYGYRESMQVQGLKALHIQNLLMV